MKNKSILFFLPLFILATTLCFAAKDPVYPFKVKLNGHEAVKLHSDAIFATVKQPVKSNAKIEVAATGQVIINVFACNRKGTPLQSHAPAILIFQAPTGNLSQTFDKKALKSGKYLANVVAEGATSRIVFDIE